MKSILEFAGKHPIWFVLITVVGIGYAAVMIDRATGGLLVSIAPGGQAAVRAGLPATPAATGTATATS